MYLKSIEVHGFKSFANKIVFEFKPGITGIVGPNGSGKSNVADAVRWVLGEQKIKQLRGSSMQDVIFSGTEMRKPLSYAYVAITLDNSDHALPVDFEEVTVGRRLYRSGESEYVINNSPCRLKDVYELFYDTGIGKEGYSIIGQGQIDKILSGKPEEKRELFDEAAGIVKFKRRKTEAMKKLDNEHANLLRVNDILTELEKQVGPLEKQSEKAKIYLKKKEELKTLDVNVFLLDHDRVLKQLEDVQEKYKNASAELEENKENFDQAKADYDFVQSEIQRLGEEIENAHALMNESLEKRSKLEIQLNILKERISSAAGNKEHLQSRVVAVQQEIDEKTADKDKILEEKKVIDQQLSEIEEKKKEANDALEEIQGKIEAHNNRIEELKNAIIDGLNARATTKSQMGRFDTMLEQVQIRKAELSSRLIRYKSDEEAQDKLIEELKENLAKISEEAKAYDSQQAEVDGRLSEIHDEMSELDEKLRKKRELYHQEKSKLETLANLTERYEGYGGSVKMVMEQKKSEKGLIGVVADIIQVDQKYEVAIETALGGNIQNVVTEDEETAKRMIGFLKKNRYGRATFLPLTALDHPQEFKNPEALKEEGAIGLADTLVNLDKKYRNVAKAMLGRILVVDTIDHAMKIARKFQYSVRMVTLEGELLVPGGAISGGAFKNNSNLLSRRRELAELEEKVTKIQKETQEIEDQISKIRDERNGLRAKVENLRMLAQNAILQQNTAQLNLDAAIEKKNEQKNDLGSLHDEEKDIEKQLQDIASDKQKVEDELSASMDKEKEMTADIEKLQAEVEGMHDQEEKQALSVSSIDLDVQKMLQKQEFEQANVDRIDAEIARHTAELQEIKDSLEHSDEEVLQNKENLKAIEETIEASFGAQSDAEKELKEKQQQKEELTEKQKNFFEKREELSSRINELDKEVYRLNAQKERQEEYVESQINYMWDEYEITLTDAAAMRQEDMTDLPAMKKSITTIKDEIRKLGDVNVNAIEDYKNLMERYTFLKGQHDDLIEAEKQLETIITELDTAMRKQFKDKFAEIGREYDKVFKELFGGGHGTLELAEDEDILEAGINITAQPPGKKLQNMMQLSGGEKALAAIALLFAIQNLKPSPFCLLDEIEAALDENNVGRFAKYLHKLTKSTQFIVITHRRGTMESADRLYGITMQEKGVSALVSVDLIDKEIIN